MHNHNYSKKILKIAGAKMTGHFLYKAAEEVLNAFPNEKIYVSEAGFTPSGKIHLGNFNDLCITYAFAEIMEFWGHKSKAILAIDSRDPFRQAPVFAPDSFKAKEKDLRGLPFDEIEDPWGCHENFAEHFIDPVIESFKNYGLKIEPIRAREIHTNPKYIELLKKVLVERDKVREIINSVREKAGHTSLYPPNWIPYRPKCSNCGRMDEDVVPISVSEDGKYVSYQCRHCGNHGVASIEKAEGKPPFRIDWPLRWMLFNVHFEPMGKDLMASGSSYDTGKALMASFFNRLAPLAIFYDFFYWIPPDDPTRQTKSKFSKRRGIGFGMDEWINYAPPEVLKYIVLRRQIIDIHRESLRHVDFSPLDIPSYVDAFDKHEEMFYRILEGKEKLSKFDADKILATYILSQVDIKDIQPKKPRRVQYYVAVEVAFWMYDLEDGLRMLRAMKKLPKDATEFEIADAKRRLKQAFNWSKLFYKISLPEINEVVRKLDRKIIDALTVLVQRALEIPENQINMQILRPIVKEISNNFNVKPKDLYQSIYLLTLGKVEGPPISRLFTKKPIREHLRKFLQMAKP